MLARRVASAAVAMPVVLLLVWVGGLWYLGALLVLATLVCLEAQAMAGRAGFRPLLPVALVTSWLLLADAWLDSGAWALTIISMAGAAGLVVILFRSGHPGAMLDWSLTLAFSIYAGLLSYYALLRNLPAGVFWVISILAATWCCDSTAYSVGRAWGRTQLAPILSPNKTAEGAAAGILAAIFASLAAAAWGGVAYVPMVGLGLLLGLAATLGDLGESFLKRQTRTKDSGGLIPGHGGILDRLDSLLFAGVVGFLYIKAIMGA